MHHVSTLLLWRLHTLVEMKKSNTENHLAHNYDYSDFLNIDKDVQDKTSEKSEFQLLIVLERMIIGTVEFWLMEQLVALSLPAWHCHWVYFVA